MVNKIRFIPALISVIAIIVGLTAIISVGIVNIELAVGLFSLTFGILAIIWTSKARKALSKGSSLKSYTTHFLLCLIFILIFSILTTFEALLSWKGFLLYLKYFFITATYLVFVLAAYKIRYLSKEFGFEIESKKIEELIKQKKRKKKR